MPTLAQITRNLAPATFGEGDDAVHMHFYPLRITSTHLRLYTDLLGMEATMPARLARYEGMADDAAAVTGVTEEFMRPIEAVTDALVDLLADWDLCEVEDGPPLPITHDALAPLGSSVLIALFMSLIASRSSGLGKATGTPSPTPTSGTSTVRARKTRSQASASRKR